MSDGMTYSKAAPLQIMEDSYRPRATWLGVGIVAAGWSAFTILSAFPLMQAYRVSFFQALYWQACQSAVMIVLSVPIWFIVFRWMYTVRWYWKGLIHLILAPIFALLNYGYLYYMVAWFGNSASAETLKRSAGFLIDFNFLIYFLQFALYHSYETLRKLRIKEKIALELSALQKEQELVTLRAQINPHFLFNTLNNISAMASTDAEETRTMIAQLADLLRYALEGSKKTVVPLQDELRFVQEYIDLEAKRLGDRLTTKLQVDPSLTSFSVPPMILQPLVENAIKHGIAPAEEGGSVCIEIQRQTDGIIFHVSNTGVSMSSADPLAAANGIGLKNTDARLRKMYGDPAGLTIRPGTEGGCEVTFRLPFNEG
jgi:two-component system LytT family sensor kinase